MSSVAPRVAFRSPQAEAEFFAAYDAVLAQWPVPVDSVDVPTPFGPTRVHACGPPDAEPLVLLPGGGSTSTVWFANVADLSRSHRVYAVDLIGDAGRSVHSGQEIGTIAELMAWLDAVLDHLDVERTNLCGHSYSGWIALNYTLHAPHRLHRLALLDPTGCFSGVAPAYMLHAVPLFARRSEHRMRAFINWETAGAPVDPTWLTLTALGFAHFPKSRIVWPRRPPAQRLRACTVPTLVLLAEKSRSHNIARAATNAERLLPHVVTTVLPGVAHHSVPTENAAQLNRQLLEFLASAEV